MRGRDRPADIRQTSGWALKVFPFHDELDILEALIVSNWQRGRNNVEIGREAAEMWTIEAERAKQRQGTRTDIQGQVPESDLTNVEIGHEASKIFGQTRDKIGTKLGVSGSKVEWAASTVKTADNLRASGTLDPRRPT